MSHADDHCRNDPVRWVSRRDGIRDSEPAPAAAFQRVKRALAAALAAGHSATLSFFFFP